ncbi:MAG: hypothetical protein M1816_000757 [Peltula sp. TS41687]|nr:MAG: hypothetical protein M1816_000757 [Peltula sp. TS41687]
MSRRTMTWDGNADQQLLLAILSTHTIKLDHAAIAQRLGPNCTPRAVEERLKKLKKLAKENGFGKDDAPAPPSAKRVKVSAASKGKKAGKPPKAEGAKSKSKRSRAELESDGDEKGETLPEGQEDQEDQDPDPGIGLGEINEDFDEEGAEETPVESN